MTSLTNSERRRPILITASFSISSCWTCGLRAKCYTHFQLLANLGSNTSGCTTQKYNVDSRCRWVLEMREKFNLTGKKAFEEFNPKPSACFLPSTIVSDVGSESEDNRTDQKLQDHGKRGREDHSAAEHSVNKERKHNPKEVGKNVMERR